jgi:3,4-dihydroxy 2-butanone 4-phosphate synthase/GTP cyclohydrolase II
MTEPIPFDRIEDAIDDIRQGKVVIVVDDEDRENEGDFLTAARNATPEVVNFMAKHGRGLICAPLTEQRCAELGLDLMVQDNTALHHTPFTVSVDVKGRGTTTGISAADRSATMMALIDPATKPDDLARPGHIFPLKARNGGVLRRTGHTEAAVDLARLAGLEPAGMIVEIMNDDGTMARLPELREIARRFDLKLISIADLVAHRMRTERLVERVVDVKLPTEFGDFDLIAYRQVNTGEEHLALVKGSWQPGEPVLVRVHSSCVTGDIFGSQRCDCGPQLHAAMRMIEQEGRGVVVYMQQEGRGIGLINKLRAYSCRRAAPTRWRPTRCSASTWTRATTAWAPRSCSTWACARCACSPTTPASAPAWWATGWRSWRTCPSRCRPTSTTATTSSPRS